MSLARGVSDEVSEGCVEAFMVQTIESASPPQLGLSVTVEVAEAGDVLRRRVSDQPFAVVTASTPCLVAFAGGAFLALEAALGLDLVGVAVNGVGGVGVGAGPAPGLEEDVRAELTDEVLEHVGGLVLHEPVLVEHGEALGAE